jgi:hypothetical protein
MRYQNIREEELKNKVGNDFFAAFDTTKIVGNIDFCNPVRVLNPDRVKDKVLNPDRVKDKVSNPGRVK